MFDNTLTTFDLPDLREVVREVAETSMHLTIMHGDVQVQVDFDACTVSYNAVRWNHAGSGVLLFAGDHGKALLIGPKLGVREVADGTLKGEIIPGWQGMSEEERWTIKVVPKALLQPAVEQAENHGTVKKGWLQERFDHPLVAAAWIAIKDSDDNDTALS